MLSTEQLAKFKTELLQLQKEFRSNDDRNGYDDLSSGYYQEALGELSGYDNHPADEGTALYDRGRDQALTIHDQHELEKVTKALTAIENGTYGYCEVCGKEIALKRLKALPATTYCIQHSPDQLIPNDRPIEEEALVRPFNFEKGNESVQFDGEDAWQELASWGTSETPSDLIIGEDRYSDVYIESDENVGFVEDFENFVGVDMTGKNITIYPNEKHEHYEDLLDEQGTMTTFGDLPASEQDPYVDKKLKE